MDIKLKRAPFGSEMNLAMLGFTEKHLFAAVVGVLALATVIWFALGFLFPAPPTMVTIAGSFVGGHYEALARRYQELLERGHLDVNVRMTEGAVENLKLLNDPRSGVQIGFVQGGVSNGEQAPDLLSLGRVDYQIFWLSISRAKRSTTSPGLRASGLPWAQSAAVHGS